MLSPSTKFSTCVVKPLCYVWNTLTTILNFTFHVTLPFESHQKRACWQRRLYDLTVRSLDDRISCTVKRRARVCSLTSIFLCTQNIVLWRVKFNKHQPFVQPFPCFPGQLPARPRLFLVLPSALPLFQTIALSGFLKARSC